VSIVVAVILAVTFLFIWLIVVQLRHGKLDEQVSVASARDALTEFAERTLELHSVAEILAFAAHGARVIFGCTRVVAFVPSTEQGGWDASVPGAEELGGVAPQLRPLFGWFRHNHATASAADLAEPRFGAMRGLLAEVMNGYQVDVVVPLVDRGQTLGALALRIGRKLTDADRELMKLFRLQVTAACANVRLHREAAHLMTLAKEVDLASAVQRALVPADPEGSLGPLRWAGHYRPAGEAGSDFWTAYRLDGHRLMLVIGDAVGTGLAGSMVSAVAKACCDAFIDAQSDTLDPGTLLGTLNRALWRPTNPLHMTCFAALLDHDKGEVQWANAGHTLPYVLGHDSGQPVLHVLAGAGPLLGDAPETGYRVHQRPLVTHDALVLYTDGIVNATNLRGIEFSERRLQRVIVAAAQGTPAALRDRILQAVEEFRGGAQLADDEALVVVRHRGESTSG
jgi:serine phosphatase RsbU (regulator of sigma subunit)